MYLHNIFLAFLSEMFVCVCRQSGGSPDVSNVKMICSTVVYSSCDSNTTCALCLSLCLSLRLRRQQQNPGLFGKMRTTRFCSENPDGQASDMDEEDEEMQLQIPWHTQTYTVIQNKLLNNHQQSHEEGEYCCSSRRTLYLQPGWHSATGSSAVFSLTASYKGSLQHFRKDFVQTQIKGSVSLLSLYTPVSCWQLSPLMAERVSNQ